MKSLLITSVGHITEIKPKDGRYFSLQELQEYVGGYIKMLTIPDGRKMIMNEEGRIHKLKINAEATRLAGGMFIVGNVVVCDETLLEN